MTDPYYDRMRTKTSVYHHYFISKYDSEVLESSIFTPHPDSKHDEGDLFIRFVSGKTYFYPKVRTATFIGLILADSAGKYFNANLRSLESHNVSTEDELVGSLSRLTELTVGV